jgi:hypothetical protein
MVFAQGVAENGTCGGLAKATLTSYAMKSILAGESGRFAFAECPRARSDPSKHRRSDLEMRIRALGFKCAHISERIAL